jgi:hypothetical protein
MPVMFLQQLLFKLLAAFMGLSGCQAAGPDDLSAAPVYLPGGIADEAGERGFVAGARSGIEALDLATGQTLWTTTEASTPLIAFRGRLAALAPLKDRWNAARVLLFDIPKGNCVLTSEPIIFPDWVPVARPWAQVEIRSEARIDRGELIFQWWARKTGGPAGAKLMSTSGMASIHLDSGRVTTSDPDKIPKPSAPKLPDNLEKVQSWTYFTGSSWETKPWITGNKIAALAAQKADGGKDRLSLVTWDLATGKSYPPVLLLQGQLLWAQVRPDGRYLFVRQGLPKEKLPEGNDDWRVFSTDTGKQLAKVPHEEGTEAAGILGSRLYFAVREWPKPLGGGRASNGARILKAVDPGTGKGLWQHDLLNIRE